MSSFVRIMWPMLLAILVLLAALMLSTHYAPWYVTGAVWLLTWPVIVRAVDACERRQESGGERAA